MDRICGNCKYNEYDVESEDFICKNEESEYYGVETFYEDTCDNFE